MAVVKFLTGTDTNLLKKNSDGSYVNPIKEGALYVTAEKVNNVWISNLYYDINGQRIKVSDTSGKAMYDHMNQNIAQTYIKQITMEGTKYASTDGATLTYVRGDGSDVTILLPLASDTKAGTVNTGAQTFAGNKTFLGQVILKGGGDTAAGTANSGALIIGDPASTHISFDGNEIQAKSKGTASSILYINNDGGVTQFGGTVQPNKDNTHSLGTSKLRWKEIYGVNINASNFYGALTGNVTGSLIGNAATADKWFKARTITLGSDLQGSVSLDGSADVTLNANHYNVSCSSGNKANYPWHRIATTGVVTGTYSDKDMTIVIRHSYNGGGYGVAKVSLRTNASGSTSQASVKWMYRYNIEADSLQIGLRKTSGNTLADLYYKVGTWARCTIYQVEGNRSWTLISSNEVNDTTSSDKKSSKEVYKSVADGGTVLSAGYTDTIKASDGATVQNANYAKTADGAITDSANHNILTHYLSNIKFDGTTYKTEKVVAELYDGQGAIKATVNFPTATASQAGAVTTGAQTFAGDKTFTGMIKFPNVTTGTTKGIQWTMGDNDQARIIAGATASNAGYLEIATADNANEPIYVRQYSGVFSTLKRTLTLLNASGNTIIPGSFLPVTHSKDTSTGQVIGGADSLWKEIYARTFYAATKYTVTSGLFYADNNGDLYVANNTGLGGTPDDNYTLKVTGDTYHTGKIYADGALYIGHTNAANALLYLNNKLALRGIDSWLRINDTKAFTSGTYFGNSLVRTDGQYQVGDGGKDFYANNSGNAYIRNSLGIGGKNTAYRLYVQGNSLHNGIAYFANGTTYYIDNNGYARFNKMNLGYTTGNFNTAYHLNVNGNGYFEKELKVNNYIYGDLGDNKIAITVGGDAATYYPVVIGTPTTKYPGTLIGITRTYSETAPSSWNTSTHKGGLTMTLLWNGSRYWDGNGSGSKRADVINLLQLEQTYCTMVANIGNSTAGLVVWLRGGGATYHIFSEKGIKLSATVYTSTYTDDASQSFAPTTTVSSDNIDSYKFYLRRTGDYMRGTLKTMNIEPREDSKYSIGTSSLRYLNTYSDNYYGDTYYFGVKLQNNAGSFWADKDGKLYVGNGAGLGVTPDTTYILKVKGNSIFNGILYFANNTTYWINNSGDAKFRQLTITSTATFQNGLRIGNNANGDTNYIAFYGTTGDGAGNYNHTYIGENLYGSSTESSELLLFKGNDIGSTTQSITGTSPGPDRIRHLAAGHLFQVMTTAISGSWTDVKKNANVKNIFEIFTNGTRTHGTAYFSSGSKYFINNSGLGHFNQISINADAGDGYSSKGHRLYVGDGTSYFKGDVTHNANIYLPYNGQIFANGTKATTSLIRVVDNSSDANGNGISIGGGGLVVVGSGESAANFVSTTKKSGGDENLFLLADGNIYLEAGGDTIGNRRGIRIDSSGNILPVVAEGLQACAFDIGSTSYSFNRVYSNWIHANAKARSNDGGITLYSNSATYSICMRIDTKYAWNTGDWHTYFNMNRDDTRGWMFKSGGITAVSISGLGYIAARRLSLQRVEGAEYGRIYWYQHSYKTWVTYMSDRPTTGAPTGKQPSGTTEVTSWAMRSLIQNNSGYGWIWESCAEGGNTPIARMSLSSNTGRLRVEGVASTAVAQSAQLMISSVVNGSSQGAAIELWRGSSASWQISNEGGTFRIRTNYWSSTASNHEYNNDIAFTIDHSTGASSLQYLTVGRTARRTDYRLYVQGNTLNNGIVYFANGTTYKIDNSGNAHFSTLAVNSSNASAQGYRLYVNGTSYFTGIAKFVNTTDATSPDTGSVQIDGGLGVNKNIWTGSWFVSQGSTGWRNNTHGGGWYMSDTTWVRIYGTKKVYVNNNNFDSFYTAGGYSSHWNSSQTLNATNTLNYKYAILNRALTTVAHNTVQPIIVWGNSVSSYGYQTRYSISSVRPSNDAWGRMRLAVGNNDAGSSIGAYLDIDGDNYISAHSKFGVNGRHTSYNFYVNGSSYFTGDVTMNGAFSPGPWLRLWSDGEGGNIRLYKYNNTSNCYEFDRAVNNHLRLYYSTNGGSAASATWYFRSDAYFETKYLYCSSHGYFGNYNHTGYALSTASFICNSWVRTTGSTGWYNETHGGGMYMTDGTYVRVYNGKMMYSSGRYLSGAVGTSWIDGQRYNNAAYNIENATNTGSYWPWMRQTSTAAGKWFSFGILNTSFYWIGSSTSRTANSYDYGMTFNIANGYLQGCTRVYAAVWNDYAEYRETKATIEPGRIVIETGKGDLVLSSERLQPGANVVSDTYGFAIGETSKAKTPIAVSGRALVYAYEDKSIYEPGDAVCTGPNGTVSKMTREEIWKYPERIVGTISEIPDYEVWGEEDVPVNGRIWIKVK